MADRIIREAVDDFEDPDHRQWQMLSSGQTVGLTEQKDLTAQDAATVRRMAYRLYYSNPYARGIIRTMGKFIFGKGVTTELVEKNVGKKKRAEEYLKEWGTVNRWDLSQKETNNRAFRDGEVFWYNRKMGRGKIPRLEFIEPDNVDSIRPEAELGIELEPDDPTTVKYFHVKKKITDPDGKPIPGESIVHIKLNVDRNVKRGRSLFEPIFKHLKLHDDWLQSRMVLNKVRSAVALVRTIEGTQAQGQVIRRQTEDTSNPRKTNRMQAFRSGSIITAPAGTKYEMLSANLGASDAATDGRNILLAIAVGVGFPEMFLTSDFSNANYSSSLTAQNPFIREFEDWQDLFDYYIKEEFKRVLELGIDAGLVDKETDLEVNNEWPPLVYEDFVANVTALGQLFMNEIISKHTYATRSGFDYDEEQELIQDEQAAQAANDIGQFGDEFGAPGEGEPNPEQPPSGETDLAASEFSEQRRSLQQLEAEAETLTEASGSQREKFLAKLQFHQQRNLAKQKALQARIALGSPHDRTMKVKAGNYARRQARIEKLAAKVGGGVVDVQAYTRQGKSGPIHVSAYTRKGKERKALAEGRITKAVALDSNDKGINVTLMVDYEDENGKTLKGFFKPAAGEHYDEAGGVRMWQKELIASDISAIVGMEKLLPATVSRSVGKFGVGALMEYINGKMKNGTEFMDLSKYDAKDLTKIYDPILSKLPAKQIGQAAAFDYLIGNRDRHPRNWRTDGSSSIGLIDHGNSFPTTSNFFLRTNFGAYAQRKKINVKDAIGDTWDGKWDAIEKILTSYKLKSSAIKLVRQRYDELVKASSAGKGFESLSIGMIDKVPEKMRRQLARK